MNNKERYKFYTTRDITLAIYSRFITNIDNFTMEKDNDDRYYYDIRLSDMNVLIDFNAYVFELCPETIFN